MIRMTVECNIPIEIFILFHSKMIWNDGMRRNGGVFGEREKKWILRCLSFCHHSVILSSFRNSNTNFALDCQNDWEWLGNDLEMKESGAVSYRDSTRFFHSDLIWIIGMTLKWKNQVLSLIETAPDSFIQTSFGSLEWPWNERIRCCLYKRQHPILSFRPHLDHSCVIQPFLSHSNTKQFYCPWNDVRMTEEWPRNERIRCCLL